tara:strand:- start:159 stop:311 length:153 start_codon:yes stop_codon:yes gene_type:complete
MDLFMREIMIFSIASVLLFTLGCNYDYGKYGKEKNESNSEKTQAEEISPK